MEKGDLRRIIITLIVLSFVAVAMFTSCKTIESVKEKQQLTISKSDAHQIVKESEKHQIFEKVYIPGESTFTIDNPCDSLGNLKDINYTAKLNNVNANVSSLNNKLTIHFKEIDSLKSVIEFKEVQLHKKDSVNNSLSQLNSELSHTIETKTKYPKLFWWSLLGNLAAIIFLIKKFTSWFSFLPF